MKKDLFPSLRNLLEEKYTDSDLIESQSNLLGFFETLLEIVKENNLNIEIDEDLQSIEEINIYKH